MAECPCRGGVSPPQLFWQAQAIQWPRSAAVPSAQQHAQASHDGIRGLHCISKALVRCAAHHVPPPHILRRLLILRRLHTQPCEGNSEDLWLREDGELAVRLRPDLVVHVALRVRLHLDEPADLGELTRPSVGSGRLCVAADAPYRVVFAICAPPLASAAVPPHTASPAMHGNVSSNAQVDGATRAKRELTRPSVGSGRLCVAADAPYRAGSTMCVQATFALRHLLHFGGPRGRPFALLA